MRSFATASILLATLVLGTDAASAAPWCTEYGGTGRSGGSNCGFYSYQQCVANAWGNGGFCTAQCIRGSVLDGPHGAKALSPRRVSFEEHKRARVPDAAQRQSAPRRRYYNLPAWSARSGPPLIRDHPEFELGKRQSFVRSRVCPARRRRRGHARRIANRG